MKDLDKDERNFGNYSIIVMFVILLIMTPTEVCGTKNDLFHYDSGWYNKNYFFKNLGTGFMVNISSTEIENITSYCIIQWTLITDNGSIVTEIQVINETTIPLLRELVYFKVQICSSCNFTANVQPYHGSLGIGVPLKPIDYESETTPNKEVNSNSDQFDFVTFGIGGGIGILLGISICMIIILYVKKKS